jgi:hypothetical protein
MKKTLSKILTASFVALAFSSYAAGPTSPVQGAGVASASSFLADLKVKLKINGPAQEQAWGIFMKGSERPMDMATFQEMARAKTTPELMNSLEKMQLQASGRFAEQKKMIVGLYDVLDADQRKLFDAFVFSTMAKMGAPNANGPR